MVCSDDKVSIQQIMSPLFGLQILPLTGIFHMWKVIVTAY